MKRTDSKSPLRTFVWNTQVATVYPDFSFDAVIQAVNNDPVARRAINHFVDKCMEGDFAIVNRKSQAYDRKSEMELDEKYNFRHAIQRKTFLFLKLFNNAFVEVVTAPSGIKALNVLSPEDIEPITKTNGDPIKYRSKSPNPVTGQYVFWPADKISWVKAGDRNIGYAPVDLRALWETLLLKDYIRRYVSWLWKTGQYRVMYGFKTNSDKDVEDFIAYAKRHDQNFQAPFMVKGEFDIKHVRDMQETQFVIDLFKYLDNQILMALNVPPVDAGIPDASGRSNADAQGNNFMTSVISLKKVVEDTFNYDLFPKINKGDMMLLFAPADRFAEKQIFEILQIMGSLNFKPEVMKEYMFDRGLVFDEKDYFKDPEEMMGAMGGNPRDQDTNPSRIGKGTGEGNKKQETVTTRSDQLRKE